MLFAAAASLAPAAPDLQYVEVLQLRSTSDSFPRSVRAGDHGPDDKLEDHDVGSISRYIPGTEPNYPAEE